MSSALAYGSLASRTRSLSSGRSPEMRCVPSSAIWRSHVPPVICLPEDDAAVAVMADDVERVLADIPITASPALAVQPALLVGEEHDRIIPLAVFGGACLCGAAFSVPTRLRASRTLSAWLLRRCAGPAIGPDRTAIAGLARRSYLLHSCGWQLPCMCSDWTFHPCPRSGSASNDAGAL